jgi:hypothetical protein
MPGMPAVMLPRVPQISDTGFTQSIESRRLRRRYLGRRYNCGAKKERLSAFEWGLRVRTRPVRETFAIPMDPALAPALVQARAHHQIAMRSCLHGFPKAVMVMTAATALARDLAAL